MSTKKQEITCETCKFFKRELNAANIGDKTGMCKRYPPTMVPIATPQGIGLSPASTIVAMQDFCGEHTLDLSGFNLLDSKKTTN